MCSNVVMYDFRLLQQHHTTPRSGCYHTCTAGIKRKIEAKLETLQVAALDQWMRRGAKGELRLPKLNHSIVLQHAIDVILELNASPAHVKMLREGTVKLGMVAGSDGEYVAWDGGVMKSGLDAVEAALREEVPGT